MYAICGICITPIEEYDSCRLAPSGEYLAHSWCLGDMPWDDAADAEFRRNERKPRFVVAVWNCDRRYGGPEEGGWSYETGFLENSIEVHDEATAEAVRDALEVGYPYTGQRGYYSKRSPDYSVRVLDRWNQYDLDEHFDVRLDIIHEYPVYRPRYE